MNWSACATSAVTAVESTVVFAVLVNIKLLATVVFVALVNIKLASATVVSNALVRVKPWETTDDVKLISDAVLDNIKLALLTARSPTSAAGIVPESTTCLILCDR